MICITKYDLSLNILFQFSKMYPLYSSKCSYRHKNRCLYLPVACKDQTGTGRCGLRGKKPAAGIALTMGIGFRAKRCFFKMVCPRQIRM